MLPDDTQSRLERKHSGRDLADVCPQRDHKARECRADVNVCWRTGVYVPNQRSLGWIGWASNETQTRGEGGRGMGAQISFNGSRLLLSWAQGTGHWDAVNARAAYRPCDDTRAEGHVEVTSLVWGSGGMKEHRGDLAANDIWGSSCQRLLTTSLRTSYTLRTPSRCGVLGARRSLLVTEIGSCLVNGYMASNRFGWTLDACVDAACPK